MQQTRVDMAIFGGGIAGLWLLARLRNAGYSALLFETRALGGVQTIASQGIIHGGAKYALTGNLSDSAKAIGDMPRIWRDCLAGSGELDLSAVRLLSEHQYLWSTENIVSRVAGFFASKAMRSRMTPVPVSERPPIFQSSAFSGKLYQLEEPVLDTGSLVAALAEQYGEYCYRIEGESIELTEGEAGAPSTLVLDGKIELQARRLILAAGAGNERLLAQLGRSGPEMQRRPLHMVMVRGGLPELYAHCLGGGTTPRITITSYPAPEPGERVWYIGGQLAESGVQRNEQEQIGAAQRELAELLPWVDLSALRWAGLRVDRAEPKSPGGRRPDSCYLQSERGVITVWPTKLAFAPRLAQELLSRIGAEGVIPREPGAVQLLDLERVPLARYPWEEAACWS
jgi:glycerol-3-phosphate dehydrogenase